MSDLRGLSGPSADDPRLVDGQHADQVGFVTHGLALTLMGLPARLAAANQFDLLRLLDRASYLSPRPTGTNINPAFTLEVEVDDDTWARLKHYCPVLEEHLKAVSLVNWTIRHSSPLTFDDRYGNVRPVTPRGVAAVFEAAGDYEMAALAERAFGFRRRPREGHGGGHHMVIIDDGTSLTPEEVRKVDDAVFHHRLFQTAVAQSLGLTALADRLSPREQEPAAQEVSPHIGVITSTGMAMRSDITPHLEVFPNQTWRTVHVSHPDAADKLAGVLAEFNALLRRIDIILMARGGGDQPDLQGLNSEAVRYQVDRLRERGTFVVAPFGHGNVHVDVHADVHAHTPTSGAEVIRRMFYDVPMLQRKAVADHRTRLDALAFDGRESPAVVIAEFTRALETIDAETDEFVERQRQREPVQDWLLR
jgi:hypothetical protein